jgi:hypothetical protein
VPPKHLDVSEENRALIKQLFASGAEIPKLAREFGVTDAVIRSCIRFDAPKPEKQVIENEHKDQSYRENLTWAMEAAGEYLRTKKKPKTCPNNAAYFLYTQAIDEPKDFMAKINQMESKADQGEHEREVRQSSRKSLAEIEEFLSKLEESNAQDKIRKQDAASA